VPTRRDGERKILLRRSEAIKGKLWAQTSRQVTQQDVRHASWQRSGPRFAPYAVIVSSYEHDSHPQPPYSLDLATCEFFLFPEIKLKLKLGRFDSIEMIQNKSQDVMKTLRRNVLQQCFRSWKSRWNRCISADGDYLNGDGGEKKRRSVVQLRQKNSWKVKKCKIYRSTGHKGPEVL